nr:hypothetical protein BaRGS_011031 [Batillaria attramentaria]
MAIANHWISAPRSLPDKNLNLLSCYVLNLSTGGERDAEAILQQYSSGDKNGLQQLARYCSIIKREYEQAKVEKKTLKEQLEKHKKSNYNLSRELSEAKSEVIALQEQLTRSEDDLKQLEKTNTVLTAKYNKLKYSRRHVAENSASFMSTPEAQQPPQDKTERVFETTPRLLSMLNNFAVDAHYDEL